MSNNSNTYNDSNKVPMMFRAQIDGRCQLHRILEDKDLEKIAFSEGIKAEQYVVRWKNQWVEVKLDAEKSLTPFFNIGVEIDDAEGKNQLKTKDYKEYEISWRFVTNGGQDDGIIRPVIGAFGLPFYPGSSMKGAFRKACTTDEQRERYCGKKLENGTFQPGILRFHGGYPVNNWTENLVDIVHPQQDFQVKENAKHSAYALISLYHPKIKFGISSTKPKETEWNEVWQIWEKALGYGIGCRVSAGYGQPQKLTGTVLYRVQLQGQGQAAQLLDESDEFRPNIFKAALRGHALRIFGGLTSAEKAADLVDTLFGGIRGQVKVGLLRMAFRDTSPQPHDNDSTYNVEGELKWLLTRHLPDEEHNALRELVKRLTQFAMLLGGFGKSWRRADHGLFFKDYDEHLIGCHWQWAGERSPVRDNPVRKLEEVGQLINTVRETAKAWMQLQGVILNPQQRASWREAWYEDNVEVWGREAKEQGNSAAIEWLHEPYSSDYRGGRWVPLTIKGSSVAGKLDQIGRLWHRMYPVVLRRPDPKDSKKALPKPTNRYLELLTLFPDGSPESDKFLEFLASEPKGFKRLWFN